MSSITCIDKTSSKEKISLSDLLPEFMSRGLGEVLMLYHGEHKICLGKLKCKNGKHVIHDEGYLSGIYADSLYHCWEKSILGAVCIKSEVQRDSLTFCGLEHCDLKVNLGDTGHLALVAAENQYGDHLIDFLGNICRGFQLMLDNHFLPVILPKHIRIKSGESGLAVTDLRAAPLPLSTILKVNNAVSESIKKHLNMDVDDMQFNPDQFAQIFHDYLLKA